LNIACIKKITCLANSLVGKRTKTLGDLPYPVFLDALDAPFVSDSKMGNTNASVLPYIANIAKLKIQKYKQEKVLVPSRPDSFFHTNLAKELQTKEV